MGKELDHVVWRGQRPWFEHWFAVVIDEGRRRALWIRHALFVPRAGAPRISVAGAWFDADAAPAARTARRVTTLPADATTLAEDGDALVRMLDASLSRTAAAGAVDGLTWDVRWQGGRELHDPVPSWLPAPMHARPFVHDGDASGRVVVDGTPIELRGRAHALHAWGKRRAPTLHWVWAPWLGDGSLEVTAVSPRDSFSLGLAELRLDGPYPLAGRPATAAHPSTLITATVAGARRLVHVRAWAEPEQMIGYAYRDTDERDLAVAQSDIGSAHYEVFTRTAPGAAWRPVEERRVAGGVAVEIHQRLPLPGVRYLPWDATALPPAPAGDAAPAPDTVPWPEVTAIVGLGLTYGDHARETGQRLDPAAPPTSFTTDARALAPGDGTVVVPDAAALRAALDALEPGLAAQVAERLPHAPAVMDYEGELALVALGPIDLDALAAGAPQPLGVAVANDLTSRLVQALGETTDAPHAYWASAKSFAGFLPVAARVWAPAGGLARMPELTLETRVNGDLRQRASTKLLMYDLAAMLRAAAGQLGRALDRGDVVLTGTPAGVGLRMSLVARKVADLTKDRLRKAELLVSTYATSTALLRPGDVVEVSAGPAGRVRTRLVV